MMLIYNINKLLDMLDNKELIKLLKRINQEMIDDPKVKTAPITDERYYQWRMPHYLYKYRILKQNGKI